MAKPAPASRGPSRGASPATRRTVAILLIAAIVGTLWVPIYARSMPKLGPFPFFYWYQLIWVPSTAVLCWIGYLLLRNKPTRSGRPAHHGGVRR